MPEIEHRAPAVQSPDAGLMILARHLAEVSHHRAAALAGAAENAAAIADALGGRADELLEAVVELRATTLEGIRARAVALAAYAPAEVEPWGHGNIGCAHALARAIIRDLIALDQAPVQAEN
ncbi:hypothetical protein [Acidocella facilis]|uniref:hypothetical protein n=1 Tax=Acidocella facilis TaxID=525 RepID=UPI001F2971DC|nr:hypothetical protein [Acidocella facilis]